MSLRERTQSPDFSYKQSIVVRTAAGTDWCETADLALTKCFPVARAGDSMHAGRHANSFTSGPVDVIVYCCAQKSLDSSRHSYTLAAPGGPSSTSDVQAAPA